MQVQRTVKRYDDDGHGKHVGLKLPLLAAVIVAARALPPQTKTNVEWQKKGTGRKHSQLCVV